MPRNKRRKTTLSFNEDITKMLVLIGDKSLITSNTPLSVQKLIVSFSFGFDHLFSNSKCHKNIRLRNNNKTAKLHKKDGWSRRVHCNQTMKTGVHFIEFEINNLSKDISIGISNSKSTINRFVGFDKNSYSLSCRGKLQHESDADYHDPYASNWSITPYADDDIIGMLLDLNNFTLSYFKNDEYLGTAFDIKDIGNNGYVFAVSMAIKGDQVSIVYDEPDKDIYFERNIEKDTNNTNNRNNMLSRKRKLEEAANDNGGDIIMPPLKKQKLDEEEVLDDFMKRQRASKFAMDKNEIINNPFYIGQNIEIYDIVSTKFVKAVIIHKENNWIMVHFDGCSSIYDQKIHVIQQKTRIRSELRLKEKNENKEDEDDDEAPDEFCDPITFEMMIEPMLVTISGITYEKSTIQEYIKENGQDPMTRQQITIDQIVPNRALRDSIERWKKKHPEINHD